jgi:hypothetical protein
VDRKFTNSPEFTTSENFLSSHAQLETRVLTSTRWMLQEWWIKYGVQLALTSVERTFFTSNALAIKIPILTVMGKSTFTIDLAARRYVLRLPNISCRLAIRNIIPMSSDIVKACKSQDLSAVKDLLLRRRYGPNDVTEDQRPLLWVRLSPIFFFSLLRLCVIRGPTPTNPSGSNAQRDRLIIEEYARQP